MTKLHLLLTLFTVLGAAVLFGVGMILGSAALRQTVPIERISEIKR